VRTFDYLLFFILLISSILLVAIGVFHSVVNSKTTYIELNDDELVYDSGIFSHHRVSAPISRITDTKIQRTFLDRLTGIADLLVNTSGTASVEIYANDFSFSELSSLHSELRSLIKNHDSKDNINSVSKT
jgi:uncharacterized membrane protein YdbT with pleckstrin-like domain